MDVDAMALIELTFFWNVFDLTNVLWAIASGVVFGGGPLLWFALQFPTASILNTRQTFFVLLACLLILGLSFFAGQVIDAAFVQDDRQIVERVFARWALWNIFAVAVAGTHAWARGFAHARKWGE